MSEGRSSSLIPLAQRENTKLGVWVFLGGEVVFFVSLILTFIFTRLTQSGYQTQFRSHLSIPIIALNTFVLVTSSYFVVRALEAISFKGNSKEMRNNLIVVVVLGVLFLGGQAFEWITLFNEGIDLTNTFGTPFFTVTGIHGTHVFIGILWVIYLLAYNRHKTFKRDDHLMVEIFGLYWHFVDIVWIVLFTVIYLL
jgi:heme/copper-type cytochrome/quinol oxidase subunit 3